MTEGNVIYCEFLGLGNPGELETDYQHAKKLYDSKLEALKQHAGLIADMSFIGIKTKDNKWLVTNGGL